VTLPDFDYNARAEPAAARPHGGGRSQQGPTAIMRRAVRADHMIHERRARGGLGTIAIAGVRHDLARVSRRAHRRAEGRAHFAHYAQDARVRARVGGNVAGRRHDRGDHRRGVLGEPAARRELCAEDLAGVRAAGLGAASAGVAQPIPLDPGKLIKVAPAVERAGIHLGVWSFGSLERELAQDKARDLLVWARFATFRRSRSSSKWWRRG